jgi:hypothetical protein
MIPNKKIKLNIINYNYITNLPTDIIDNIYLNYLPLKDIYYMCIVLNNCDVLCKLRNILDWKDYNKTIKNNTNNPVAISKILPVFMKYTRFRHDIELLQKIYINLLHNCNIFSIYNKLNIFNELLGTVTELLISNNIIIEPTTVFVIKKYDSINILSYNTDDPSKTETLVTINIGQHTNFMFLDDIDHTIDTYNNNKFKIIDTNIAAFQLQDYTNNSELIILYCKYTELDEHYDTDIAIKIINDCDYLYIDYEKYTDTSVIKGTILHVQRNIFDY